MSPCRRSTPRSSAEAAGFSTVEMLAALGLVSLIIAATASFISQNRRFMSDARIRLETNVTARLVADLVARDLRLGGACLPTTGDFVALEGDDAGSDDEIVTRAGILRDDLTCIRSATRQDIDAGGRRIKIEDTDGFEPGMRAYIRGTSGTGEFFTIAAVSVERRWIKSKSALTQAYLATSGVYAIDERRYYIEETPGEAPSLMMQVGDEAPVPFATGIEALDIEYQLRRSCPPCEVVRLPSGEEWALVEQLFLTVTARSEKPLRDGSFYRRTVRLGIKPRNLLPQ